MIQEPYTSPIQLDAWVYPVVAIVVLVLLVCGLAMLMSGVVRFWDFLRDRRIR